MNYFKRTYYSRLFGEQKVWQWDFAIGVMGLTLVGCVLALGWCAYMMLR